jgi:MFS family permease
MHSLLDRFSLQSAEWTSGISIVILAIWMTVVGCIISSILTQPFDRRQRIFWISIVILVPGIGVLAYLPFAFRKEDLPPIFQRRLKRSKRTVKHPVDPEA